MGDRVRVGIAGTSWWADAMYLPAIVDHPQADIRGIAGGRRPEHTREFARRWRIPHAFDTVAQLLDAEPLDALLVLVPNRAHFEVAMAGLERGLHVLCEKPLGMSAREARLLAEAAQARGRTTMVPFTYRYMPVNRYVKELIDEGWLGRPYHLNLRYYTGFGRSGAYAWRFDVGEAGSGILGDLGSHWADMARWTFGEIRAVSAVVSHLVPRGPRPDGAPYEVAEDAALLLVEFENGATGAIHTSSLAHEPGPFGQRHQMDFHGSEGTLRSDCDWLTRQSLEGQRADAAEPRAMEVPERIWNGVRRTTVHDTYRDVFRTQDSMARRFIRSVAEGVPVTPSFADGLAVQRVLEAADRSARQGRRVEIAEIEADGG